MKQVLHRKLTNIGVITNKKKLIATATWRQGILHPWSSEITIVHVAPHLCISSLKPLNTLADTYDLWLTGTVPTHNFLSCHTL